MSAGSCRLPGWLTERLHGRTRGQVLVLFAMTMTVTLGMTALALDVSFALNAKREYQKVAAICAVVGAQSYNAIPIDNTQITNVKNAAASCVLTNTGLTVTPNVPPTTGSHTTDNKFVEVIISNPQKTFFATVFGINFLPATARAVAGGFEPVDFAIMSLRGNIDSTLSVGGPNADVKGNACTRGKFKVNGNFTVEGETSANQGFDGSTVPTSSGGNDNPGTSCLDPNFALPTPLPTYTAPATSGVTCVQDNNCGSNTQISCPASAAATVQVTDSNGEVDVNCGSGKVQIFNPRSLVSLDGQNQATVELMGSWNGTGETSGSPGIFQKVDASSNPGKTPLLLLKPGYYDVINLGSLGTSSSASANCGSYTATVCFKPGLYLISTGLNGNNGVDIASQTTGPSAGGGGVSIVVGITFDPRAGGGGSGGLTLDCCASDTNMEANYVLLYHLGGCLLPYSTSGQAVASIHQPPYAADTRVIFPTWPAATPPNTGSWTCSASTSGFPLNEMQLQGNNKTQTYNGTVYSPYQCASSPVPPGDTTFPAKCASGSASGGGTRLPQFTCGTTTNAYCIQIGGGTTSFNGKLIAPDISFNGNGVTVAPPNGSNALGVHPYLAE